jgi:hypothetical protein
MSGLIHHPEFQKLLQEAESLRLRVAQCLAELHDLEYAVKPHLMALFQAKLGAWELKQLTAQCQVARLKRMIALAQAAINGERPIDWEAIDAQLDQEFLTWKTRIAEATAHVRQAEEQLKKQACTPAEAAEFKALYRALVKALHPDLHPNQPCGHGQVWEQVQAAYEAADLAKLRALKAALHELKVGPSSPTGHDELKTEIASLQGHRERLQRELEQLKAQPPFTLEAQLRSDTWVETRRAEIDTECAALANLEAQLQTHLQVLAAHPSNGTVTGLN